MLEGSFWIHVCTCVDREKLKAVLKTAKVPLASCSLLARDFDMVAHIIHFSLCGLVCGFSCFVTVMASYCLVLSVCSHVAVGGAFLFVSGL